jgi:hypothetical protein
LRYARNANPPTTSNTNVPGSGTGARLAVAFTADGGAKTAPGLGLPIVKLDPARSAMTPFNTNLPLFTCPGYSIDSTDP